MKSWASDVPYADLEEPHVEREVQDLDGGQPYAERGVPYAYVEEPYA